MQSKTYTLENRAKCLYEDARRLLNYQKWNYEELDGDRIFIESVKDGRLDEQGLADHEEDLDCLLGSLVSKIDHKALCWNCFSDYHLKDPDGALRYVYGLEGEGDLTYEEMRDLPVTPGPCAQCGTATKFPVDEIYEEVEEVEEAASSRPGRWDIPAGLKEVVVPVERGENEFRCETCSQCFGLDELPFYQEGGQVFATCPCGGRCTIVNPVDRARWLLKTRAKSRD